MAGHRDADSRADLLMGQAFAQDDANGAARARNRGTESETPGLGFRHRAEANGSS